MDFRLLGAIEVWTDGGALALGGPRPRAVLADLALNVGRTVPTTRLIEDIWGQAPPTSALQTLETYIYRLRRVLEASGADGISVVTRPTGYMLDAPPDRVDVYRFRALAGRGGAAVERGDAAAALTLVNAALALWRGPALSDIQRAEFAPGAAERLEDERLSAVEALFDTRLRLGHHRELVSELEAVIAGAPYRESLHAQLMLALYRSGRQAEALGAFRRARGLLAGELGIEPGRELRELERAILLQAPELEPPGGAVQRALSLVAGPASAAGRPDRRPTGAPPPAGAAKLALGRPGWRWGAAVAMAGVAAGIGVSILLTTPSSRAEALSDSVAELTVTGNGVSRSLPLPSTPGAAVSADGSVWVTNPEKNVVYRIDPATAAIAQTIPVGSDPSAITSANGDIWVANTLDGTISRINPAADAVTQKINVGTEPTGIAAGGGSIWVADAADSSLSAINPVSGELTSTTSLDSAPFGVTYGAGSVWLTSPADDSVTRVDPRSRKAGQRIPVGGSGPTAIVFGLGSIWVTNALDSTVSRLDPNTDTVAATIPVGDGPEALTIAGASVWAANRLSSTVTRINAGDDSRTRTLLVDGRPVALTTFAGRVWAAIGDGATRAAGGTLRVLNSSPPTSIDSALIYPNAQPQLSEATYDTLVTFQKTGGSGGLQLIPDLALAMPGVSAGGTAYTFTLRPGLRYSNGLPVRPRDFRYALERVLQLNPSASSFLQSIVGAPACLPGKRCDLSRGVNVDDSAHTVTFRLTRPDPDFLYKLAFEFNAPVPSSVPRHDVGRAAVPATGAYMITRYVAGHEIVFARNPYFREWSAAAQPQGSPDRIVWTFGTPVARESLEIQNGQADWTDDVLPDTATLAARYPNRLHVSPLPAIVYTAFNTRTAPFNDRRVRRAFSLAADRGRFVTLLGGPDSAAPACQILPPGIPGYHPYCPFTAGSGAPGIWTRPNLPAARRLVAASGTRGMRITVWSDSQAPDPTTGAFTVSVLRELGYQARLHTATHVAMQAQVNDSRRAIQATDGVWQADYPSASDFFDLFFRCSDFRLNDPAATRDGSFFCDRAADRLMNRADREQIADPVAAARSWRSVDRAVTSAAPWVTLAVLNNVDLLSARVSGYQYNPFLGVLVDQLHVRR